MPCFFAVHCTFEGERVKTLNFSFFPVYDQAKNTRRAENCCGRGELERENITIMQSWGERLRSKLILFLPSIERESRSVALARLVRWPVEDRKRFI